MLHKSRMRMFEIPSQDNILDKACLFPVAGHTASNHDEAHLQILNLHKSFSFYIVSNVSLIVNSSSVETCASSVTRAPRNKSVDNIVLCKLAYSERYVALN